MNAQRLQGLVFSFSALGVAFAATTLGRFSPQSELIVLAALIVVLGIPHGAMDTIFAQKLYGIRTPWAWARFGLVYLLLASLVVGLWAWVPAVFLAGFLIISTAHFSGDPAEGTPLFSRILYGGAVLVLPNIWHEDEITALFSKLVGTPAAGAIVPILVGLTWPWLIGLVLAIAERWRNDKLTAFEFASVGLLACVAPPLLSFTLFFCGMHSARHMIRAFIYSGRASWRFLLLASLLPLLGVACASLVAWYFMRSTPLDERMVQIVFVGLAALTVPHMALVERVRLRAWLQESPPASKHG